MGIFYREKTFRAGKKIKKNDFVPSEKYACYAPVTLYPRQTKFNYTRPFTHLSWLTGLRKGEKVRESGRKGERLNKNRVGEEHGKSIS